jgi:hypothetical protein
MITVREYLDLRGRNPFEEWFAYLDAPAADNSATSTIRIEQGNILNTEVSAPVSVNAASNSAPDVESTSGKKETRWSPGLARC